MYRQIKTPGHPLFYVFIDVLERTHVKNGAHKFFRLGQGDGADHFLYFGDDKRTHTVFIQPEAEKNDRCIGVSRHFTAHSHGNPLIMGAFNYGFQQAQHTGMKRLIQIGEYKFLHEQVKGKKRDEKTWDIQAKMKLSIRRQGDCAVMFYGNDEGIAYYASALGDNVHALIWLVIENYYNFCFKYVELGEQVFYPGQEMLNGKFATEKNVNISAFKKGFGGKTVTRLILEK